MSIFLEITLIVVLMFVFIQDLKHRAIHVSLPILIGTIGFYSFFFESRNPNIIWYNFVFLILTFSFLFIYLTLKNKKLINPLNSIGLGDILFFIAVVPFFSTTNYILYFITGMVFSALLFILIKNFNKNQNMLVPLAGLLALYMILIKFIFFMTDFNLYETQLI